MPSLLTLVSTGPMTNRLRNTDSPASTWLGGTDCNPSAFLVSDKTMKILVKLVTRSSSDGAIASTVSNSSTVSDWLGLFPPMLTVTEPSPPVGEVGEVGPFGPFGEVTAWPARGAAVPVVVVVVGAVGTAG